MNEVRGSFPKIFKRLILPVKYIENTNLGGWSRVSITVMDDQDLKALSVTAKVEQNQEKIVEIIVDSKLFDLVSQSDFPLPEFFTIHYTSAQDPILHI